MKRLFYLLSILLLIITSTIAQSPAKVEIYLIEKDGKLDNIPLLRDEDIASYNPATTTFHLRHNLNPIWSTLKKGQSFAVTINKKPVYIGFFESGFSSYRKYGITTIMLEIVGYNKTLIINHDTLDNDLKTKQSDKRNDPKLLKALKASGRLENK